MMDSVHANKFGWKYFLLGGLMAGSLASAYNFLIFKVFGFYPEILQEISGDFFNLQNPLLLIFFKDFLVGFVLTYLFRHACFEINRKTWKGIMYFIFYSLFAFVMFGLGDIYLLRRFEGVFLILTVDGFVETLLCTIPVKIFSKDCFE